MTEHDGGRRMSPRPFGVLVWTLLVTVGVALGLAAPVAAFVAAKRLDFPPWVAYPTVALGGALLGLCVGVAQAAALHRTVLAVPRAGWSLLTMAGALVAWSVGLFPATLEALGEPLELTDRPLLVATAAGAVVLVLIVPVAQWLLLRRVLAGAWLWILVEAVATIVAVAAVWGVSIVVDTSRPLADLAPILAAGGGAVAFAFALVTGFGLLMMAPRAHPTPAD